MGPPLFTGCGLPILKLMPGRRWQPRSGTRRAHAAPCGAHFRHGARVGGGSEGAGGLWTPAKTVVKTGCLINVH